MAKNESWTISKETGESDRVQKLIPLRNGNRLSYLQIVELWINSESFRSHFNSWLCDSDFAAFRWETPAVTKRTFNREFEFVLLDAPELARPADQGAFAEHFVDEPFAIFSNLGGDCTLVVPCPISGADTQPYAHLASFVRGAPSQQTNQLWKTVGQTMKQSFTAQPIWLNTAGTGISWLHIRLDSRPKYYGHGPYRQAP